jgi:predicted metalloprotease
MTPSTPRRRGNAGAVIITMFAAASVLAMGTVGALTYTSTASGGTSASRGTAKAPAWTHSDPTLQPDSRSGSANVTGPTSPQVVVALAGNPINAASNTVTPTRCTLPPFSNSVAGQDALYQAVTPCLMASWTAALRKSHLPVQVPSVVTSGSDIPTQCGLRHWNDTAMYCPGNNTIYVTARHYSEVEGRTSAGAYLGQFAHEFGHAVQHMTGIYQAKDDELDRSGGQETPAGMQVTRRTELQATCFEGMELASLRKGGLSDAYIAAALDDSRHRGDEYNSQPDHGTMAINAFWLDRGYNSDAVSQCNTWAAPSSAVN